MKAASKVKLTKKEQPKGDNANGKEITNSEASSGETTPEIVARSRRRLTRISEGREGFEFTRSFVSNLPSFYYLLLITLKCFYWLNNENAHKNKNSFIGQT
jgi:hypothetical protein